LDIFITYVDCKKHRKDLLVQVELVRKLYEIVEAYRVNSRLLITTLYFTKGAKAFTEQVK